MSAFVDSHGAGPRWGYLHGSSPIIFRCGCSQSHGRWKKLRLPRTRGASNRRPPRVPLPIYSIVRIRSWECCDSRVVRGVEGQLARAMGFPSLPLPITRSSASGVGVLRLSHSSRVPRRQSFFFFFFFFFSGVQGASRQAVAASERTSSRVNEK